MVIDPLRSYGSYNFKVYWGDGTSDIITTYNQAETLHQYASTGIYEIRIGGEISGFVGLLVVAIKIKLLKFITGVH